VLSLVSLVVVCAFAFVVLRWLGRRGLGQSDSSLRVRARCYLEPRRSLYVVETAGRCFLLGVGEGPISLIAEIDPASLSSAGAADEPRGRSFADALGKVLRRRS
jgi:flagellar biosynthetic protein FliO